jgi:osmotically-inducible protein OsmY
MGTRDQRYDDDRRYQEESGGTSMTRADERSGNRSMQGGESSGGGGSWYGYVQPYRYYGPGYRGVGYYSVMYQGGDRAAEEGAWSGQEGESLGSQGGQYGQSGQYGQYGQGGQYGQSGGPGRYAGRGPRGYQRSDERIREDISDRLMEHPDIDASDIEVQVKDGEVTLTGTVDERRTKRMAEDLIERCSGVRDVMNQLKVRQGGDWSSQGSHDQASRSGSRQSKTSADATQSSRAGSTPSSRSSNGSQQRDQSNERETANQR